MPSSEFPFTCEDETDDIYAVIKEASDSPSLTRLRRETGTATANGLRDTGRTLHVHGHTIGRGRVEGTSPHGNGDDEVVAVGALLQIAGEVMLPAVELLSTGQHYAGAALLRQLVEVEYLMWAFASNPGETSAWLNSTREERLTFFRPGRLRDKSNGRFKHRDYEHHCEMGGHPVPRSLVLLGGAGNAVVQMLIVDALLHTWRTTDSAVEWAKHKDILEAIGGALRPVGTALRAWSEADPLYGLLPPAAG